MPTRTAAFRARSFHRVFVSPWEVCAEGDVAVLLLFWGFIVAAFARRQYERCLDK